MKMRAVIVVAILTIVNLAGSAVSVEAAERDISDGVSVEEAVMPDPLACVYGGTLKMFCMDTSGGGDGGSDAEVCVYDEVYQALLPAWGVDDELACVVTNDEWGLVGGPGACATVRDVDRPTACVDGESECLLTLAGLSYICWAGDS